MNTTLNTTSADPKDRLIADLQRQLAASNAERDEAIARETATAEVLQMINSSPGDLVPMFDAMLDPRVGLIEYGPLQPMPGDRVRIGVIGTADTADGFTRFIERCTRGIEGKRSPLRNLYPPFPGIGNQNPFRCTFQVDAAARRIIPVRDIERLERFPIRLHSRHCERNSGILVVSRGRRCGR